MDIVEMITWFAGLLTVASIFGGAFLHLYKKEWGVRLLYLSAGLGLTFIASFFMSGQDKPWFAVFLVLLLLTLGIFVINLFLRNSEGAKKKVLWIGNVLVLAICIIAFGFTMKYDSILSKSSEVATAKPHNEEEEITSDDNVSASDSSDETTMEENETDDNSELDSTNPGDATFDITITDFKNKWSAMANENEMYAINTITDMNYDAQTGIYKGKVTDYLGIEAKIDPDTEKIIYIATVSPVTQEGQTIIAGNISVGTAILQTIVNPALTPDERGEIAIKQLGFGLKETDLTTIDNSYIYKGDTYFLRNLDGLVFFIAAKGEYHKKE
ncbi:hypothetical protein CN918_30385 [Priestia megaterium]|nr:hypothetical protein CN918_30385 [Priestia megaterium]